MQSCLRCIAMRVRSSTRLHLPRQQLSGAHARLILAVALHILPAACTLQRASAGLSPKTKAVPDRGPGDLRDSTSKVCGRPHSMPWVITADSVGPIPLKASVEEVRLLCPEARDTVDALFNYGAVLIPGFGSALRVEPLSFLYIRDTVPRGPMGVVVIETPLVRTVDGLGVGSTLGDLRRLLGPMLILAEPELGVFAVPRSNPRGGREFKVGGLDATAVPGGWAGDTLANSNLASDNLRVTRVQVWAPRN